MIRYLFVYRSHFFDFGFIGPACLLQDLRKRFAAFFSPALREDEFSGKQFVAEFVLFSTDLKSTRALQSLVASISLPDMSQIGVKDVQVEKAQFLAPIGRSLSAIFEKHGLIVVHGPLPPHAKTYDVSLLLTFRDDQPEPEPKPGFGYGVIFDTIDSVAIVQFADDFYNILESDILDRFSLFKTGLPNPPKDLRDKFFAGDPLEPDPTDGQSSA